MLNLIKWYRFLVRLAAKEYQFRQDELKRPNDCWIAPDSCLHMFTDELIDESIPDALHV